MTKYILGVDIGTGSTKAVAVDANFNPIAESQGHYPTNSPLPGYHEQNPELIYHTFIACVQKVVANIGYPPQALGLSCAMHSVIPIDENGKPMAPMRTWADSRYISIAKELRETAVGKQIYNLTGTPLHAMSPLCKIIGIQQYESDLFNNSYKFISIKEYIWLKLFNEYKIDHSIASCTGLFDIHSLQWCKEALHIAGLSHNQLSEPVETSYHKSGKELCDGVLPTLDSTLFVIGASDGCLANLGSHAIEAGTAAITIGTSGAVRIASNQPILNDKLMPFSYILDKQTFICGGPINNGGMVLDWLYNNILAHHDASSVNYEELFNGIDTLPPGSDGLLFLPYLSGERAPIWDEESTGSYVGLTLKHNRQHIVRATLEGICFALNDVLQGLISCSIDIKQISVSGGFVNSGVWMQMLADITGKPLLLEQTKDASAIGAAHLAANVVGYTKPNPSSKERILPDQKRHELYKDHFQLFRNLYLNLRSTMHQLNLNKS